MGDDFIENVRRQDAIERALEQARRPAQKPRTTTNGAAEGGYIAAAFRAEIEAVRTAPGGTRNGQLNTSAFRIGTLVGAGAIERGTAEQELYDAAIHAGLTVKETRATIRSGLEAGMKNPRDLSGIGSNGAYFGIEPKTLANPVLTFAEIEDGFWVSRKSLQDIYISALSRMCSPWAVLAVCAARALALVRPHVVLPPIIGGRGSLNWFAAITAVSGGGKGAASGVAEQLVADYVLQRNSGSGEGIVNAYIRPKTDEEPGGLHESIMFMVDEIDSLTAVSQRSGSTTMSVLRSAFSGETLGFSYVNKKTPYLEKNTYRMTMVMSVQPTRASNLLDDHRGGTPQRIMWFPGTDERITADIAGGFVTPLEMPPHTEWLYPKTIEIPVAARDLILRERVKLMQNKTGALDGHALFVREKFAYALAVLDGRAFMTQQDWELSGIAAKVSDHTRDWVSAKVAEAVDEDATEKGRLHGVSSVAADEEKDWRVQERRKRVTGVILRQLGDAGQQGMSNRELTHRIAHRDRGLLRGLLNSLLNDERVRFDTDEKRWYIVD